MILTWLTKYRDAGLLLLRLGIGVLYLMHGWPKLAGGAEQWKKLGAAMKSLGITFLPEVWGFLAAFAEFGGAILLILGFLFRPACLLLGVTMVVATVMLYGNGSDFTLWSHPAKMVVLFFCLMLIGPGRFSVDKN